ncbi:MAG: hypothetical protein MUF25_27170, partial [Pirellulaceae bacterium]|nr:hypothetical protein [Pirellulaceae bacterium]
AADDGEDARGLVLAAGCRFATGDAAGGGGGGVGAGVGVGDEGLGGVAVTESSDAEVLAGTAAALGVGPPVPSVRCPVRWSSESTSEAAAIPAAGTGGRAAAWR